MTKLALSYAILALEAEGFEQAHNKPLSFCKNVGSVTLLCRLSEIEGVITGAYIATIALEGETLQVKLSKPVMTQGDIGSAVTELFRAYTTMLDEYTELALIAYESRMLQLQEFARRLASSALASIGRD